MLDWHQHFYEMLGTIIALVGVVYTVLQYRKKDPPPTVNNTASGSNINQAGRDLNLYNGPTSITPGEGASSTKALESLLAAHIRVESPRIDVQFIPMAVKYDGIGWCRFVDGRPVSMDQEDVLRGKHLRHMLKVTNIGRTPAHILRYEISFSLVPQGVEDLPDGKVIAFREYDCLLAAGQPVDVTDEILDVSAFLNDDVLTWKASAVFHGWVTYEHGLSTSPEKEPFKYVFYPSENRLIRGDKVRQPPIATISFGKGPPPPWMLQPKPSVLREPDFQIAPDITPLPNDESTVRELVRHIVQPGTHKTLTAYTQTNDKRHVSRYAVEFDYPGRPGGKGVTTTDNKDVANGQWLKFYGEFKKAGFGGTFGNGLDGTPPFN